ncbi:FAD-dependent oxidoreductase, partial [Klebsiella pneumoniae]
DITEKYGLDVQRKRGHLTAAVHPGHLDALHEGMKARQYLDEKNTSMLTQDELREHVQSDNYFGGQLDQLGGHIHPLALTRGLAYGFCQNG